MNELLEKAIDRIRALPEAEQETVAALILERFPDGQRRDIPSARPWLGPVVPLGTDPGVPHSPPEIPEILKHPDWEATPENAEQISEYIKALIESSRVLEARRIVSEIRPGVSEKLDYWKKILAEPVARVAGPGSGGDMRKDILWFEKNAGKYKGRWVALKEGMLIGSHESRAELRRSLKQSDRLSGTTFFKI